MLYLSSHGPGATSNPATASNLIAISVKDAPYNAVGDGVADDRAAIQAAIADAASQGRPLWIPAGTYRVTRAPGLNHSLILQDLSNVRIFGEPGRTRIKHANDVAGTAGSCQLWRITGCTNVEIDGITTDGNWGNGVVSARILQGTDFSGHADLAALPSNELPYYGDASRFPASGSLVVVTATSTQTLTYTGKTATKFTGVSAGTGVIQDGDRIGRFNKSQASTTITAGSNGQVLPQGTINVGSTTKFPTSVAANGIVQIFTGTVWESIQYTGKTATTLTGCTGGTGTLATGQSVIYVDGAGNQVGAAPQVDPKNHHYFIYGNTGSARSENRNITLRNCTFEDAYGDFVWVGAWTHTVTIENCQGRVSARNGLTLSSFATNVTMRQTQLSDTFTSAVDSEPVDAPVNGVVIDNCDLGIWFDHRPDTAGNIALSLQGGVVGRPAEWNYIRDVVVTNSRIRGATLISDAKNVVISKCKMYCDFTQSSMAPVTITMFCDGVSVSDCDIFSALIPANQYNYGAVSLSAYRTGLNSAAQPANVKITGNRISARNGIIGVYSEATGGYVGYNGTAISYTPPTGSVNGEIEVAGTPWASQIDHWIGHQIEMGGKIANVVGNDGNTLFISPLYEYYVSGMAWTDHLGRPLPAPAPGAFKLFSTGGRVEINDNTIDCRNRDGKGAGGYGISVDTATTWTTTWDFGYNDTRVVLARNDIRGATGRAINVNLMTGSAPLRELQVIDNHAWDDQVVPSTTNHLYFTNAAQISDRVIYGNTQDSPILPVTGLDGVWRQSDSYPGSWAGYVNPNGLITAPPTATYHHLGAGAVFVKESDGGSNTGWNPLVGSIRAGIRSIGASVSGTGSLNMAGSMPSSVVGDIELLIISTTFLSAVGSDATLSTPAGFVKKVSNTSNQGSGNIVNRGAIWWRRVKHGDVAPVVADSGDHNTALVIAIKDAIGYGDPFDFVPVASQNNGTTQVITATGGTTTTDACLYFVAATWFSSGPTNEVNGWTNTDTDLTEQVEALDRGVIAGFEKIGIALYTGRVETAASIGTTTATHAAENYAVWSAIVFAIRSAVPLGRASGLITCTSKANYVDGEVMCTIGDGMIPPKEYEADVNGTGVTAGRVQVNIQPDTTAAQVAARLRSAILAAHPSIGVTDNGDGSLTLLHQWPGSGGNVTITEAVANAGHTVSGMSGGQG